MLLPLLFQAPTPNTVSYLILGYVIIGGIGLVYVLLLLWRQRNLRRDLDVIERLHGDED
jgi:hypothetical protein